MSEEAGSESLLRVERPQDGCVLLTLDRPRARNALSLALRREIVRVFDRLREDPELRCVVLTGAGDAFCAGLDLKELGSTDDAAAAVVPVRADDPVLAVTSFPWPVIAAVNGVAITGGFELALACDLVLASEQARFADTHARVGVLPGWGLSQKLPRLIGSARAKELAFTGNFLDARTAEAWGLVNRVVPPPQLLPQALRLAADMASALPEALRAYKRLIDDGAALPLADALRLEKQRSAEWARGLAANAVEERRRAIAERGRLQQRAD
ncbi:MAG: Enoyl-CoA hydratase [Ramlibacter sp.]|jgi:enoyl-CoA hydratase|nr:Enoyl-CoA hydratase [Ramlibacter sp.]MDB5914636.1 Enoyl-CoA hydratase [Ramlibacter sp.]